MPDELFSLNGPYARAMKWLWNMLVISILWAVCCIPVFTIGAAIHTGRSGEMVLSINVSYPLHDYP